MIVAQVLNKIYLTIAQSIARFGRFFCVELLRFNTCDKQGAIEDVQKAAKLFCSQGNPKCQKAQDALKELQL
jgi:hypothetical protein